MNSILSKIKNTFTPKNKKAKSLTVVILTLLISQLIIPADILASGPKFNFLQGDYELLRGSNASQSETSWHDPVNASAGDAVAVIVYYHNGVEDTTAKNTKIKVNLPTTPAKKIVSNGYLWADNASQVTDTFTVNTTQNAFLEYIYGTTQWYANGSQTPQTLPDGITTENGINIGDIKGCWQYSGYVVFQARVKIPGVPGLVIDKKVANSSTDAGTQSWVDQNTAKPGDILAYRLYYLNNGTSVAKNVKISDNLPLNVSYIKSTTMLFNNQTGTQGKKQADTITTTGINLGNIEPGGPNSGYIVFQVKVNINLAPGEYALINTAKIKADNVAEKQDTAKTIVSLSGNVDATITKLVRNISQNQTEFVKSNTALAGQTLEYKISFDINGNTKAKKLRVKDLLPSVNGVPVKYVNGSTKITLNGHTTSVSDAIITNTGLVLGDYNPNTNAYITLQVKIGSCPAVGTYKLINYADIAAENIKAKKDFAATTITVTPPPQPILHIEKLVKNISTNENDWVDFNIAVPGDILEYYISFKNTGEGEATIVKLNDVLPANVVYIAGTTELHANGGVTKMSDEITANGIIVPNLKSGEEGYITFEVITSKNLSNGTILTDVAHIKSKEGAYDKDSASTKIKKITPVVVKPKKPVIIEKPIVKVLGVKTLPSTGGMIMLILVLASAIVGTYYYFKAKKEFSANYIKNRLI